MTKSNAQRQAEYRQRHFKDIDGGLERINLAVPVTTKRKLERLATCYGVTQRAVLESVLEAEERRAVECMNSEEQEAYYSLRRNDAREESQAFKTIRDRDLIEKPLQEVPILSPEIAGNPAIENVPETKPENSDPAPTTSDEAPKTGNPKSGYPGVTWHKQSGRWQVNVRENGKQKSIGTCDTPEEGRAKQLAYLAKRDNQ